MTLRFPDQAEDRLLRFAVIAARSGGGWVYCRHRQRRTWELPGGHREPGESIELKTFVDILPLSRSAVVHHLKVLEQAGLLIPHKHGRALSYTLNLACAVHALGQVKTYADELLAATEAAQ